MTKKEKRHKLYRELIAWVKVRHPLLMKYRTTTINRAIGE